jgi:Na+/melibiose symporter-like transporter
VPLVALILALPLSIWYPITRKSHTELLKRLDAKDAATLTDASG